MASVREDRGLQVSLWPDRDRVLVVVSGELDIASVGVLQQALDELRSAEWRNVVLDLRELSFIDAWGLTLLLRAERAAFQAGAGFAIVDGSAAVVRLLELAGLEDHFSRARVR